MADRARHPFLDALRGDARIRHASLLRLALVLVIAAPSVARAQSQPRPWLDWQTSETEHFALHYPSAYREWALDLAQRMEGVRGQVRQLVGFAPERRVHVVVDDPTNDANGTAFTALDAPTIVLWPTPPNPRSDIGNYAVWEELLATHEFTHVAHLTRPSRNRFQRLLWSLSPVPLGPIATKAPRWVLEGYATFVEGRVTRSGRPNHAWRATLLRQLAVEGRLPRYAELSATGGWQTGSYAYLVGSAYLEWLAQQQGDSSVTALWQRLTARTDRSFDAAFQGVYGASPAEKYGRFAAEVTAGALSLERALTARGLVSGELVQRLQRTTGDPAISPDNRFIALTVRRAEAPSRLVVWKTVEAPDTTLARRRAEAIRRDPEDVPDRQFYPAPRKEIASLLSNDGAPYETPRWMPDNLHLLLTRVMPLTDGTLRPDLFLWSAEDGDLRRVTHGAALRDADPSADGSWAAAVRCAHGWCDLVRVELATGAVRVLQSGSVTRNFYRPRVSKTTGEIAVAEQSGDRWRIARVSPDGGTLRYADPDDGATRYDATFDRDGRTIVCTSERGLIANLERLAPEGAAAERLTSVTGAAIAADVAPDGSLWFLSLQGTGYDLRQIAKPAALASVQPADDAAIAAAVAARLLPPPPPAATRPDSSLRPSLGEVGEERLYGLGPTRLRYLPMTTMGFGGATAGLALVRSDPVGRLGVMLLGVTGSAALPQGFSLVATSHSKLTAVGVEGWTSHEAPSRAFEPAQKMGLDLARAGGALRIERPRVADADLMDLQLALLGEYQRPSGYQAAARAALVGTAERTLRQRDQDTRYQERIWLLGEVGRTEGGQYGRHRGALEIGVGRAASPLTTFTAAYGRIEAGTPAEREDYVVGGFASPLVDPMLDARRVSAPAYPLGTTTGPTFNSYRIEVPLSPVSLFYEGVSVDLFKHPLRSFGAQFATTVPAVAALGTPDVQLLAGLTRAVDEPVKRLWQFYLRVGVRPD